MDMLKYHNGGPEVGLSQAVQVVNFADKILIRKLGEVTIRLLHSVTE